MPDDYSNEGSHNHRTFHPIRVIGAVFILAIISITVLAYLPNARPCILTRPRLKACLQTMGNFEEELLFIAEDITVDEMQNQMLSACSCPSGGIYSIDKSSGMFRINCSIHGNLSSPILPAREPSIHLYYQDPLILAAAIVIILWIILIFKIFNLLKKH